MTLPARHRAVVAVATGLLPWAVIPYESGLSLVFSFGLVTPTPFRVQSVLDFLTAAYALPTSLLAYPTATLLYALALCSALLAVADREDRRVTAGLFALAGVDLLYFAISFSSTRSGVVAVPVGTALLWLAAWANRPESWLLAE